jgi:probable phosphoglycerate mutase
VATTLHLVRHGQAVGDESVDPTLSPLGIRQAHAVAARLERLGAQEIVHSPRRRAAQTAHIISERLGIPTSPSGLVDDRTPVPKDRSDVPGRFHRFLDDVPADERDVDGRLIDDAIGTLSMDTRAPRELIVITHNFVIGWMVRHALDAPAWRWLGLHQDNGALTTIAYRPEGARLVTFNEVGHLPPTSPENDAG